MLNAPLLQVILHNLGCGASGIRIHPTESKGDVTLRLGLWIKENGYTHESFVQYSRENGATFSRHAVSKWCSGARIPRPEEMRLIHRLTHGIVEPNDFYYLQN